MKILHLTTHLNRGGISKYILLVGGALRERGHELFVVSSGGEMEDEFLAHSIQVKKLPIRTKSELSPKLYAHLPELVRFVRDEKIDVLHAHTRVTQVMAFWAGKLTGRPVITTCHGFYKKRLGRKILPAWGSFVVAISDPVGEHLQTAFGVPSKRIRVIFNGIDFKSLRARFLTHEGGRVRTQYGIPPSCQVLGVTARLVPDKGHEFLIRAVKELEEFPDLRVLIVGDGPYRGHLEELARKLSLEERICFIGNTRDISKPLAATDIFVLPAVWREGFGLSIVEAMVCGKPVVVTNIWALNALIHDGVDGILVEPRNVGALADGIRRLLRDPEMRATIGETGRRTAEERFSLERMANEIEGVYREVAGE